MPEGALYSPLALLGIFGLVLLDHRLVGRSRIPLCGADNPVEFFLANVAPYFVIGDWSCGQCQGGVVDNRQRVRVAWLAAYPYRLLAKYIDGQVEGDPCLSGHQFWRDKCW
jgi:hypothetical protein